MTTSAKHRAWLADQLRAYALLAESGEIAAAVVIGVTADGKVSSCGRWMGDESVRTQLLAAIAVVTSRIISGEGVVEGQP
jgi:hypothetical protein